jgi:glycogen debranching enzyme
VEIQALWYNALKIMELLAKRFDQKEAREQYSRIAKKAAQSFNKKFWSHNHGYLFDVVRKDQSDSSLRPNQIIAASLDFSLLDNTKRKKIVDTSWKKLWGKYGLRTLSADDLHYVGEYVGGWDRRNKAYHNGTIWAWLTGPFVTAFLKTKKYAKQWRNFAFKNFLHPLFQEEPLRAGLGTISEIFDGDAPHVPRGCIAQAWSVAEPFRAFVEDVVLKRPPHEKEVFKVINGG